MSRPPASRGREPRRTSFARRDSNLALLGAVLSGVVLAVALFLLLFSRINPDQGERLRGAMLDAVSPLLAVTHAPLEAIRRLGSAIGDHWQVVEKNRALEANLKLATQRANKAEALAVEVRRLEDLLKLRRPERRLVASAVVSASAGNAGVRSAIINAGLSDGVKPRMPVIAAQGLAGRVTDVGQHASRIMLLTDANSRVPVKVLRTGWTGMLVGTGSTTLEFAFDIASGIDRIRVGDRLVTSGDGGLFPPNVPVAVVTDVGHEPPRARPLANPTGLGVVMVEAPWLPPPAFVPAPPAPSEADVSAVSPAPSAAAPPATAPSSIAAPTTTAAPPTPSPAARTAAPATTRTAPPRT